ncbi:hypothetical protein [Sphingomonas bacterium]|uniref:hypothetical protein n=1 Tax=Sphingomonas bacterium TaxID=1895847 RepID=UPI0026138D88|nr:hypothetical protein [Sphingomonas bacterium]
MKNCDSYRGKTVRAAGYLDDCADNDCQLFADKKAIGISADAWKAVRNAKRDSAEWPKAWNRLAAVAPIGIGYDETFDRKAASLQHSYVVITGRVSKDSCTGFATGTDRAFGIDPIDIRPWTPADGAPANMQ